MGTEGPDRAAIEEAVRQQAAVDLYWLPLGAGGHFVRLNGRIYEALTARVQRRSVCDLYHSALQVELAGGRFVIEQTPVPRLSGEDHGVVAGGAVGARRPRASGSSATRSGSGGAGISPMWRRR